MYRSLLSCLLLLPAVCHAFSVSSSFAGSSSCVAAGVSNGATMEMKKGKSVPPQMRSQYKRQQQMAQMQKEMIKASKAGEDGLPVFNLFVRTKKVNMWYPAGSFKGDERSAALAKSYVEGGMLSGVSKKQLDAGIAGSLYRDLDRTKETICRSFPQLRKSKDSLEFGYKLDVIGMPEEMKSKVQVVEPKEQKGFLDGVRNIFS